jgi:hypothetical protein
MPINKERGYQMKKKNILNLVLAIFLLTGIFIIVGFVIQKKYKYVLESATIYVFFLSYIFIERRGNFRTEDFIKILVILSLISHSLIGRYFELYRNSKWFDDLLHVFGSFSFALFYYSIINETIGIYYKNKIFPFIFIILLGTSSGTFFELIEFSVDILFNTNAQNGLLDTNLDMLFNTIGAFLAALFYHKKRENNIIDYK